MEKNISSKLLLSAFAGLVLGVLGVAKSNWVNSPSPWLNQEKLALSESNIERMCPSESSKKSVSLFVSCAGFLE